MIVNILELTDEQRKEIKEKGLDVVIHDELFHIDEMLVIIELEKFCEFPVRYHRVNRDSDMEELAKKYEYCLFADVGHGRYDHHDCQQFTYDNGVKEASCGLVLNDIPLPKRFKELILQKSLYGVQSQDCGQKEFKGKFPNVFTFVHCFNAKDTKSPVQNENFQKALNIAREVFNNLLYRIAEQIADEKPVVEAIKEHHGHIMELKEFCLGWQDVTVAYNNEESTKEDDKIIYVVFPSPDKTQFRVQGVPVENGSFECLKFLPEEWRGKEENQINELAGITSAVFVHPNGFIGGARTHEDVMKMAKVALEA